VLLVLIAVAELFRASAQSGGDPSPAAPGAPLAPEMSSAHFKLEWYVIAGGALQGQSTHFRVSGTVGQAVVGQDKSAHFGVCKGFWCGLLRRTIHLPVIFK
jgi:hypothetical protein